MGYCTITFKQCVPFLLLLSMSFLAGCLPKKKQNIEHNHEQWHEQEARLYDIPLLIDAQPHQYFDQNNKSTVYITYHSHVNADDAMTFYLQEMECHGWQQLAVFDHQENLLIFEKPTKKCAISIRPVENNKKQIAVVIMISIY